MRFRHIRAAAVMLICLMVLALAGCGASDPDGKVAKVNDTVITRGQLDNYSVLYMYTLGFDPNDITDEEKSTILDQMVNTEVLRQYFEGLQGETIYGESFDEDVQKFVAAAKSSEKDFLDKYGITDEDIEYLYRANYLNSTLYTQIQNEHAEADLIAKAEDYYDQHQDDYKTESGVKPFDEVKDDIYYSFIQDYYDQKLDEMKEGCVIEIDG